MLLITADSIETLYYQIRMSTGISGGYYLASLFDDEQILKAKALKNEKDQNNSVLFQWFFNHIRDLNPDRMSFG